MNDIHIIKYVMARQIIAIQPLNKKFKCFFNYNFNVRTGFLGPENMGKNTKTDFLSQLFLSQLLLLQGS